MNSEYNEINNKFKQKNIKSSLAKRLMLIGLIIFFIATYIKDSSSLNNQNILNFFVNNRANGLTIFFVNFTNIISPLNLVYFSILVSVFLLFKKKDKVKTFLLISASVTTATSSIALKSIFRNSRPSVEFMVTPFELDYSFPSGHTLMIFALMLSMTYIFNSDKINIRQLFYWLSSTIILTIAIAISRLYLGYHWFTDIIASIGVGLIVTSFIIFLDIIIQKRRLKL